MTKTINAALLPRLQLTQQDEFALRQLGAQLQREIVSQYEAYLFQSKRHVDDARWKLARSEGEIHAFSERKGALKRDLLTLQADRRTCNAILRETTTTSTTSTTSNPETSSPFLPQATLAVQSQLRRVLITGVLPGTLDDIMYGASFQDTESFQRFWAVQNDAMEESAVLNKIESATLEDPYRFMGVTWFLRKFPVPNKVLNQRDLLTFTDVHLSKLSNGERVGISILHVIQHRDLPELHEFDTVRAASSVLRVFRQLDKQRVEVFMTQYLDTKGSAPESFSLQQAVGYMLPTAGCFQDGGFRKKLYWMLLCRDLQRRGSINSCDSIEPTGSGTADHCEVCNKTIGGRLFSSNGSSCQLCFKRICSRCTVPQDLSVACSRSHSKKAAARAIDVCIECILRAKSMPTLSVAQEEFKYISRSHAMGSGSNSSSSSSSNGSTSRANTIGNCSRNDREPRKLASTVLSMGDA